MYQLILIIAFLTQPATSSVPSVMISPDTMAQWEGQGLCHCQSHSITTYHKGKLPHHAGTAGEI